MGILTKSEKKTKAVMVRVPSNLMQIVDALVGWQYTSRPDFIVESIRYYLNYISGIETEAMILLKDKDVSFAAKFAFYQESLEIVLAPTRDTYKDLEEKSNGKLIDVLLSIMPGLIAEINETVGRTQFFKSYQEFIKMAVFHYTTVIAKRNTNTMLTTNFLQNGEDLMGLRAELDKLRKEMGATPRSGEDENE